MGLMASPQNGGYTSSAGWTASNVDKEAAMAGKYIIAHDVGTGGNKAVLVDPQGHVHSRAFEPYVVTYPRPDRAEQKPEDWWRAVTRSTQQLLAESGVQPGEILCVTHSTQMLGVVPMTTDGEPLRPGIIWLDGRAQKQARQIMRKFLGPKVFAVAAGTPLSGKDVVPKMLWLKQNEPDVYNRTAKFLDVSGYLLYRSTGLMVADWTAASVVGLDLKKKQWLTWLFNYIGLDPAKLPTLVKSTDRVGGLTAQAASECGLLEGTPVIAGAGDAPSAAVGSGAVGEGEGHIYLGTSGWVAVVTERIVTGKHGIVSIHSADPGKAFLIAETETAGACLQWIADQFYREEQKDPAIGNVFALMDRDVETIEPGSGHLIFTPWMYGERAPIADTFVRSTFFNLSADHQREHLLRAVYEGVAYNLRWIMEVMERSFGHRQEVFRVIGGGAAGAPWMQIIADVTGKCIETVPNPQEAGAVGAALVAAVGLGIYSDFAALKDVIKVARTFEPQSDHAGVYDGLFAAYKKIYRSLKAVYREVNEERFSYEARGGKSLNIQPDEVM
jgi:xylulokinase